MPVKLTPQELAEKWGSRLKGAITDIERGVRAVQRAPGLDAAAAADKWQQRISSAETKRKWTRRIGSVSLIDWQNAIITKGIPRIASGVDAAQGKMMRFAEQLIAYENTLLVTIEAMPDLTLEHSIARMTTWIRGMAKFEVAE